MRGGAAALHRPSARPPMPPAPAPPTRPPAADHVLFHAPYNKLVQKAFARLVYHDYCAHGGAPAALAAGAGWDLGDGSHPRAPMQMPAELERALVAHAFPTYDRKVGCWVKQRKEQSGARGLGRGGLAASDRVRACARACVPPALTADIQARALTLPHLIQLTPPQVRPSTCVARQCGNMYTASIWSGIPQAGAGRAVLGWAGHAGSVLAPASSRSLPSPRAAPAPRPALARPPPTPPCRPRPPSTPAADRDDGRGAGGAPHPALLVRQRHLGLHVLAGGPRARVAALGAGPPAGHGALRGGAGRGGRGGARRTRCAGRRAATAGRGTRASAWQSAAADGSKPHPPHPPSHPAHPSPPPQSDLAMRLARRVPKSPEDFETAVQLAEQR